MKYQDTREKEKGRPIRTWDDTIKKILNSKAMTINDAKKLTTNKKEWAKFLYETPG